MIAMGLSGRRRDSHLSRALVALVVALAATLIATTAFARGSVRLNSSKINENDGHWNLKVTLDYGGVPHIGHIPMVFSFTQKTLYERYVDDTTGDTPAVRRIPVNNATPIDLPMDVGFADMSGKVFKITKFDVRLTREHDFEAGEYTLKVRLADGGAIGQPINIVLDGNNKVINRKSIAFDAPDPKPKKTEAPKSDSPEEPRSGAAEDFGPDMEDIPDISDEEAKEMSNDGPPEVDPKQGGCGCAVVGAPAPATPWSSLLGRGLVALGVARRRA